MKRRLNLLSITSLLGLMLIGLVMMRISPLTVQAHTESPLIFAETQQPACELLEQARTRSLMSAAFETKLLFQCGRLTLPEEQPTEPNLVELAPAQTDVLVNSPFTDVGSSTTQSETSIAINPNTGTICSAYNDSQHLAVGSIAFAGFSNSTNNGATFLDRGPIPAGGGGNAFGDPSLVWRQSDGKFYFASLHSNGLGLWRSDDDCTSMTYVGMIHTGSGDDKELMAVDNNPDSPYYGRLYVAWTDFSTTAHIYVTYSDNAITWSTPVDVSGKVNTQGAWPYVDPNNGRLYVAWVHWDVYPDGPIDIEIASSTNGGNSFTALTNPVNNVTNPRHNTATTNCSRPALNANIRYLPAPQLAVGPDSALHVVYSYDPDGNGIGDVINVYYRRSVDQGVSWGPEIQLNDDATLTDQWFPTISVGPNNVVVATWYDRRLDTVSNFMFDYYKAFSYDGGLHWGSNIRVSDVSSSVPSLDPNFDPIVADCYHGDYDQQVQYNGSTYIQWSDDRNTQNAHPDPDIWFDKESIPFGTLDGLVYDAATSDPIPGALVTAEGTFHFETTSAPDGLYDFLVAPDTYDVTGMAFGYLSNTINSVTVISGTITSQNIPLTLASHYTVEGYVTDATTGWPLYASIDTNSPAGIIWTNPETGYYSIILPEAYPFNFEVAAWVPGYLPESRAIGALTGNTSQDFALVADTITCEAPGYQLIYSLYDDFESGYGNWSGTGLWNSESETDTCGSQVAPFPSPSNAAYYGQDGICTYNTGSATSGSLTTYSAVPILTDSWLRFDSYEQTECGGDCGYDNRYVEISTNGGITWLSLGEGSIEDSWYLKTFDLSGYAGNNARFRLRFDSLDGIGNDYFGWMVDNVAVTSCQPPPTGGLVMGNVYNQNSLDPVVGAEVFNDSGETTIALATPLDPNIDDAFYTLFSPAGDHDFTATHPAPYGSDNATVSTAIGGTVWQDFFLPAPTIALEPENLEVWLLSGTANFIHPTGLELNNAGGTDLGFEIREKEGNFTPILQSISIPASDGNFVRGEAAPSAGAVPVGAVSDRVPSSLPSAPFPIGTLGYATETVNHFHTSIGMSLPEVLPNLGAFDTGSNFPGAGEYVDGYVYVVDTANNLYKLDPETGAVLSTISITAPPVGETYSGMALDPTTDTVYASSTSVGASSLFSVDLPSGNATLIGPITGSNCNIAIAIDGNGQLYGYDICTDDFWSINKATGAGTLIGSIGFDANFGQGMDWDPVTDQIYLTAFNNGTFQAELRIADRATGNTSLVGVLGESDPGGLCQVPWLGLFPDVPWVWEAPISGVVPADGSFNVEISFTALYPDMSTPMPLGTYTAALLVNNDVPVTDSQSVPVTMHIVSTFVDPQTSFTSNSPVIIGNNVAFTNTSTEGLPPTEYYFWDFGDGKTSQTSNANPVNHNYASPGVYTVTLTSHQTQTGVEVVYSDTVVVMENMYLPIITKQ